MDIPATVTSKGQITIPASVRRALGLHAGDRVLFRIEDGRVSIHTEDAGAKRGEVALEKLPDFFELAGSVPVPPGVDPADWQAQREAGWMAAVRDRQ